MGNWPEKSKRSCAEVDLVGWGDRFGASEIKERPTPAAYFLLAWAYYKGGDSGRSIDIIKKEVEGKTSDPDILAKIDKIFLEETKKM